MDANMKLGERLKIIRLDRSLSREKVAAQLGCHKTNLAHIEADRQSPSVEQLRKFAHLYDCTMEQLVEGPLPVREVAPPAEGDVGPVVPARKPRRARASQVDNADDDASETTLDMTREELAARVGDEDDVPDALLDAAESPILGKRTEAA